MKSSWEVRVKVGPFSLTEISGHFSSSLLWGFDLDSENHRAWKAWHTVGRKDSQPKGQGWEGGVDTLIPVAQGHGWENLKGRAVTALSCQAGHRT